MMAWADRYCPPIINTWKSENGAVITGYHEASHAYLHKEAERALACEKNEMPTGVPVPLHVIAIVDAAFGLRWCPDEATVLWRVARELLAEAERRRQSACARSA